MRVDSAGHAGTWRAGERAMRVWGALASEVFVCRASLARGSGWAWLVGMDAATRIGLGMAWPTLARSSHVAQNFFIFIFIT